MKYLKLYEGFQSEEEVSKICKKFGIKNWSVNSEGLVDVNGDVNLISRGLDKIPLRFGSVTGDFHCTNNRFTSLEGCPRSVGGDFYCSYNQLTSFEGPRYIERDFLCDDNPIFSVWEIISPDWKWDSSIMDLFNDYDALRGNDIVLDRFNEFLEEIGLEPVQKVDGYNNI